MIVTLSLSKANGKEFFRFQVFGTQIEGILVIFKIYMENLKEIY